MYSKKDKKLSIALYYQYEHSWRSVVRKLGYPSLGALKRRWIKEYEKDPKAALMLDLRTDFLLPCKLIA